MKVLVIGAGYVGLVTAACLARLGHTVMCADRDNKKIEGLSSGEISFYEPGLEDLVKEGLNSGLLHFVCHLKGVATESEVIFIAVGTPHDPVANKADLRQVFNVADDIAPHLSRSVENRQTIVVKSTVPPGTCKEVQHHLQKYAPSAQFEVVSNPEFLREGSAIYDFIQPDRIVVGASSELAYAQMTQLYQTFVDQGIPLVKTDLVSSELIKYASNGFLAMKLAYMNELSDLCEKKGADIGDVATGMGLDNRIGEVFLKVGPGYGGSCFPKDTRALSEVAKEAEAPLTLLNAVIESNESRFVKLAARILSLYPAHKEPLTFAVWGLTFKQGTDDLRESPSLKIIDYLRRHGCEIKAYDPYGMKHINALSAKGIQVVDNPYQVAENADGLLVLTEWDCFKSLDLNKVKSVMKLPFLVDYRNLLNSYEAKRVGFDYHCLGKVTPKVSRNNAT